MSFIHRHELSVTFKSVHCFSQRESEKGESGVGVRGKERGGNVKVCVCVCVCVPACRYAYVRTHAHVCVYQSVCVYVCMRVCVEKKAK